MAATNYTPIQLYFSTTASAVPLAANLAQGELAINITDGKLYYEDNGGVVQVIATKGAGTIGGSTTQIQYNNAGALAGNAAMVFNNSTNVTTLTTLNLTNALGATYGGTAQSAYAQGDVLYASATNTLSKLGIGTVNYILTSTGSVPQWVAPTSITVNTATNLAGGTGGSVPYQSAADTTTFLAIGAANRVMTSSGTVPQWVTALTGLTGVSSSSITDTGLTSGRVTYASTGGLLADSTNLTFNGTTLSAGGFSTTGLSTLVKTVTIGDSNFNGAAVFAAATPAKLYMGTGTVTDVTSAASATNTTGAIASLAITPIAATNTAVTYTNASTLYIAGAPSAGTNITITNPYALYVAAGAAYFGGAVTFASSIGALTVSSLTDTGLTSGRVTYATTGGLLTDSANLLFNGTTLTANTLNLTNALGTAYGGTGLTSFTANGVVYASSTSALATGSALTFDGANLGVGIAVPLVRLHVATSGNTPIIGETTGGTTSYLNLRNTGGQAYIASSTNDLLFALTAGATEGMRLTSGGLVVGSTTVPTVGSTAMLAVGNANGGTQAITQSGSIVYRTSASTSGVDFFNPNSSPLQWYTAGTGRMVLDASGRLLVAATTSLASTYLLQVGGPFQSISTNLISVTDSSTVYRGTPDGTGYEHAQVYSGRDATSATYGSYLAFYTENKNSGTSNTSTEKGRFTATGKLAIGNTSTPQGRVSIWGSPASSIELTIDTTATYGEIQTFASSPLYLNRQGNNVISNSGGGNFGIGTATPAYKLVASNAGAEGIEFGPGYVAGKNLFQSYNRSGSAYVQLDSDASLFTWAIAGSEAIRLDASKNLIVGDTVNATGSASRFYVLGTTSVVASTFKSVRADYECSVLWSNTTTGNNIFATFGTETALTTRGSITYNRAGGLTVYNTTSDYRAKDIYGPVADSGLIIDSTPVYIGKMHGATQERPMFLAHETPEYAHTGEKDAVDKDGKPVYQQMDASALIPVMWAEIQSLRKRLKAANI